MDSIWIFHGGGASFASGAFTSREKAELWIKEYSLSGLLTQYPLDQGVYDWTISNGYFTPITERHKSSEFIQRFSSAYTGHFHYENGICESGDL